MSDDSQPGTSIFRSERHMRVILALFGLILVTAQCVMERPGSYDVISYIAAADVFLAGGDPYGQAILSTPRYDGLPFVYPPGTLFFFAPLGCLPTVAGIAIDGVLRLVVFAWAVAWLQRRYLPQFMTEHVIAATVLVAPVLNALVAANFVVYCFAAFVGCVALSEGDETPRDLAKAALCGLVIAFKPMWLVAGFIFFARAKWRALGAWIGGVGVLGLMSLAQWDLFWSWLGRVDALRHAFPLADLPTLAPTAYVIAVVAWVLFTLGLLVRCWGNPALAVHACTSVLVWPRCDIHTHLVVLWLVAWVWHRYGARTTIAASLGLWFVAPAILRAADVQMLGPGFGWYPEILGYYASSVALSLLLWRTLLRDGRPLTT